MSDYDVAIIGFGPSGAVAASLLGQAGIKTLVVDKSQTIYAIPRAIALDHEIMRVFQNLGVASAVLPHVAPFTASEHFGAQGQLIRRIDMVQPPYPFGYIPSMVFTQPPVEAALRKHAASYKQVEIALGLTFKSLSQHQNHVTLTLSDDQGATRHVTARYAIGCDGATSEVRKHLNIKLEDLVFDEPWVVVDIQANPSGLAKLPQKSAQYCNPARPVTFIVGPANHRRFEIMLNPDENPAQMQTEAEVWNLLKPWLTPADGTLWRASSYRFHALLAQEWQVGNVFIAGDAAHQQPPFIGQGMCQGIRDVVNLCWKLGHVINNTAAPALLATYTTERRQHVRTLTTRIKTIGHMICERDPAKAALRDETLLASNGGTAPSVTRQDIVPPLETGLLHAVSHPANGTLFPQPCVHNANHTPQLLDHITGTGWRLVFDARSHTPATTLPLAITSLGIIPKSHEKTLNFSNTTNLFMEEDNIITTWFDRHECYAALIRPDHYVYGVASTPADIATLLGSWHASPAGPLHQKEISL